jgi:uncharacterized protein YjbJ (UPF0337 family)
MASFLRIRSTAVGRACVRGTLCFPARSESCARCGEPTERTISSTTEKGSGIANEAIGKAKQGVGKAVGSDKLQADGAAQELKGDVQKALGNAKGAVKDDAMKGADAVNKKL